MMKNVTLKKKSDAGNPHVRFDEGEAASAQPRRGSLLHNTIGKLALVVGSATISFSAIAETNVWSGVSGADWSVEGNWSLGRVPETTDWVKFDTAVTVAPPETFAGVFWVTNTQVTANIADATRFTLKLNDSTFTKTGNGKLTVQPCRGINPGSIVISQGEVAFAGNGGEAPGAFDKLVVNDGAKASVIESPIATRHGAVMRGGYVSETGVPEGFTTEEYYYWFAGNIRLKEMSLYDFMWDNYFAVTGGTQMTEILLPDRSANKAVAYEMQITPQVLQATKSPTMQMIRGIYLAEDAATTSHYIKNGPGGGTMTAWFMDGALKGGFCWGGTDAATQYRFGFANGWHEMTFALWSESYYGWNSNWLRYTREGCCADDNRRLTEDVLWLGVCFNEIDLKAEGEIEIGDGQALGLSRTLGSNLAGSIKGKSANTMFSVMSTYRNTASRNAGPLALGALDGFVGKVEIGRTAEVKLPATAASATYSVEGKGYVNLAAGTEGRLASTFAGTIVVPADVSVTLPNTAAQAVAGEGKVTVNAATAAKTLANFGGTILLPNGATTTVCDFFGHANGHSAIQLSDGQNATIKRSDAVSRYTQSEKMPDVSDTDNWTYMGFSTIKGIGAPDKTSIPVTAESVMPHMEDDKLILSDAADMSRRGVFLTGMRLDIEDDWQCEFDVKAYLPDPPTYAGHHGWKEECRSGLVGVMLCDGTPTASYDTGANTAYLGWEGTCGFWQSFYDTGTFLSVYDRAVIDGGEVVATSFPDLNTLNPYRIKAYGHQGWLTIEYWQNGKLCGRRSMDASRAFASGYATFGIIGSSDFWGDENVSVPWIRLEITNFSGEKKIPVAEVEVTGTQEDDPAMTISSANWTVGEDSTLSGSTITLMPRKESFRFGKAVCNTPISPTQAFEASFDVTYSKSASDGTATMQAFMLQTEGTNPVMAKDGSEAGPCQLKNTMGYGFATLTYDNLGLMMFSGYGTSSEYFKIHSVANTLDINANVANHVTIIYNGAGVMAVTYVSDGKTDTFSARFPGLVDETKLAYLTLTLATTWADCGTVTVTNFRYAPRTSVNEIAPLYVPLAVKGTDAATLKLPSNGIDFRQVALDGGAKLTVSPAEATASAKVSVVVAANASAAQLTAGAGMTLDVQSLTFGGEQIGSLKLSGDGSFTWANPLAVIMPEVWSHIMSIPLVDVTEANGTPSEGYTIRNENGEAITRGRIVNESGVLTYERNGMLLILK